MGRPLGLLGSSGSGFFGSELEPNSTGDGCFSGSFVTGSVGGAGDEGRDASSCCSVPAGIFEPHLLQFPSGIGASRVYFC